MSTATLTWTLPTTRVDNTPLAPGDIAQVDIYDTSSPTPDVPIFSLAGGGTSYTTDVLAVGVHNFWVAVQDTTGHRSAPSNMATVTVPAVLANPSAVTDLAATLNS